MDWWSWLKIAERPRLWRAKRNLNAACFNLMKLAPARYMIEAAIAAGHLAQGGRIVETTSRTFGLALALLAASGGFRLNLVTADSLIDDRLRRQLLFLGADVTVTKDLLRNGDQRGRLEELRTIMAHDPTAFWPRQYDNPDNRRAYHTIADQLLGECGDVDMIVGSVGTGGSLFGIADRLRQRLPGLEVVAVDTHRSVLFGHPPGPRMLRGLGNSILPANVIHKMVDQVHWVGAFPAYASAHSLLHQCGLFMGPTSGAVMLVATWIAQRQPGTRILAILPDDGHRYEDTIFNREWLARLPGWPIELPAAPQILKHPVAGDESEWTAIGWKRRPPIISPDANLES